MGQRCESCGQQLPHDGEASDAASDEATEDAGQWLGPPGEKEPVTPPFSGRAARSGGQRRVVFGLAALVLAWGAFVGIGRLTSPDESIDEKAAERAAQRALRDASAAEDDYVAADAAPGAPATPTIPFGEGGEFEDLGGVGGSQRDNFIDGQNTNARVAVTLQVDRLKRQLDRRDSTAFVAYRSANGVVLIDLARGLAQEVPVDIESLTAPSSTASTQAPVPGAHVLRSGPFSFGIDPATLDIELIGTGLSLVVADSRDGATYAVSGADRLVQSAIVEVVSDGAPGSLSQPIGGLQLQPVDGLGLLAVPNSGAGATLIADVATGSFTVLSPNRVLTGRANAVLEQVCTSSGPCTLELADLATEDRSTIPDSFVRFGDNYSVSPDGGAVLRQSPQGFAEMFVVDSNAIAWVVGAGMRHPAWGPNSDFVVWLDEIGTPELKIMFADERDWLTIDLRDLGAPPPVSLELIAFSFDQPAAG